MTLNSVNKVLAKSAEDIAEKEFWHILGSLVKKGKFASVECSEIKNAFEEWKQLNRPMPAKRIKEFLLERLGRR